MCQECLSLRVPHKAAVISRLEWGRSCSRAHSHGCPCSHWLLVDDTCSWPHGPLHRAAHNMTGGFYQNRGSKKESWEQERANKMEVRVFLSFYQKWHSTTVAILFLEESLDLAHTQGEGITQVCEYHEAGHRGHLEAACHRRGEGSQHRERGRVGTRCVSKLTKSTTECFSEQYPGKERKEHLSMLGKFPKVYWNRPPKEDWTKRLKREAEDSRIKQFIKGTYRLKQSLGWKQAGRSPHPTADGGLTYTDMLGEPKNIYTF